MSLHKFERKLRNKTNDEVLKTLLNLNNIYYLALRLRAENTNPINPIKDEKLIEKLEKKIQITRKVLQENQNGCLSCCNQR